MSMKKTGIFVFTLLFLCSAHLAAYADTPTSMPCHTVTLSDCTIGEGEMVSYTTVSSQFAGQELPEGMYAGALTVELAGQIVVEQGGTLSIGTLSVGSDQEESPILHATLSTNPVIVVKPGGRLILTDVGLDTTGEGLLILQHPGSSISLTHTQLPQELVQWAPPTINNLNDAPQDLWLEEGTALTASQLPTTLTTNLQYQGQQERREIPLDWDMSIYDGRTTGEITITGAFLDEEGNPIPSMLPLTTTVHWYQPEELVVTDVMWKGQNACSAHFTLFQLPEHAQVVGEISTDGGKTWTPWPEFDVGYDYNGSVVCNFYQVDNTPQHYRIVATHPWEPTFWASKSFLLPQEDGDDSEGNRGGSTTPVTPDRDPVVPESQPSQEPQPTPTPSRPSGNSTQLDVAVSSAPEPSPTPSASPQPEPTASPSPALSTQSSVSPQSKTLCKPIQLLLVVAGIAICAGLGLWIAGKK